MSAKEHYEKKVKEQEGQHGQPNFTVDDIKTIQHKTIEDVKGKENELLNEYSKFLEENGYLDTDWWAEEPFAIDEFKKSDQYKEWCSIREKLKV